MKKKIIAFLSCFLVLSIFAIPVYAEPVDYKANGKLVEYGVADPNCEVINGRWSIVVKGEDDVVFKAFYRERNLVEEVENSPVGSIDEFWISLIDIDTVDIDYDTGACTITGDFNIKKKWWILPDNPDYPYPPQFVWQDSQRTGVVTIDETGITIWFWGKLEGPTLAIHN